MGIYFWQIIIIIIVCFYFYGYYYSYKLALRKGRRPFIWVLLYFLIGPFSLISLKLKNKL